MDLIQIDNVTIKLTGTKNKIKKLECENLRVYMYWSGNACYKINVKPHKNVETPIHFQGWKDENLYQGPSESLFLFSQRIEEVDWCLV